MKTIDYKTVISISGNVDFYKSVPEFKPVYDSGLKLYKALQEKGFIDENGKKLKCISCSAGSIVRSYTAKLYELFLQIYETMYNSDKQKLLPIKKFFNEDRVEMISKNGTRMVI